jgi:hypothetical protein
VSRLVREAAWTAAVAGLVLVVGCGDAGIRPARSAVVPSTQAPFGQDTVRQEMDAAVVAAGLPEGETEAGFPKPRHSAGAAATEKVQKVAALAARLSPCVVTWSSDDATGTSEAAAAKAYRQFDAMLADLSAHGWKETTPTEDVPMQNNGIHVIATYKKRGWILTGSHRLSAAVLPRPDRRPRRRASHHRCQGPYAQHAHRPVCNQHRHA